MATNLYLFDNLYSKKVRPRTRKVLRDTLAIYKEQSLDSMEVTGCLVSNTNGWVDCFYSEAQYPIELDLYKYNYVMIENDVNHDTMVYFGFIDRIEPNNFNEEESPSYRIYFNIDWWTTMLYNNEASVNQITANLEGGVVRAHIDDVEEYRTSMQETQWKPYLDKTLLIPEVPVAYEEREEEPIGRASGSGVRWLYMLLEGDKNQTADIQIGEKRFTSSLGLFVIPLVETEAYDVDPTSDGNYNIDYRYINGAGNVFYTKYKTKGIRSVNSITDSRVVGMWIGDCTENYDVTSKTLYFNMGEQIGSAYVQNPIAEEVECEKDGMELQGKTAIKVFPVWGLVQPLKYPYSNINLTPPTRYSAEYQIPATYDQYLYNIVKADFAPYVNTYITKGDDSIQIDTVHVNTSYMFEININGFGSSYLVYLSNTLLSEHSSYRTLDSSGDCYPTMKTYDYYTKTQANIQIAKSFTKMVISLVGMAGSARAGDSGGALAGFGKAVDSALDMTSNILTAKQQRMLGVDGVRVDDSPVNGIVNEPRLLITKPNRASDNYIRKDLALYGYNTYLHPHEVLSGNERKYFNYIKTSNATILAPCANDTVKNHIEQMFNDGVWLWNTTEEVGNFEVPNYPLIMEK